MGKLIGFEFSSRIKEYYLNVSEHSGVKEELERLEKDLSAMMGRMKAAQAGNFQK